MTERRVRMQAGGMIEPSAEEDDAYINEAVGRGQSLAEWWMEEAHADVTRAASRAVEYGSYDLILLGQVLAELMGWDEPPESDAAALGCFFYLQGKVARMAAAFKRHEWPSYDTLKDAGIYVRMMQRLHESGEWP